MVSTAAEPSATRLFLTFLVVPRGRSLGFTVPGSAAVGVSLSIIELYAAAEKTLLHRGSRARSSANASQPLLAPQLRLVPRREPALPRRRRGLRAARASLSRNESRPVPRARPGGTGDAGARADRVGERGARRL